LNSAWYQSSGRSVWQIGICGTSWMPEDAIGPVFWACLGIDAGADDMGAEG
jgi:hypothetical protein